jgi:hypothetical protein
LVCLAGDGIVSLLPDRRGGGRLGGAIPRKRTTPVG